MLEPYLYVRYTRIKMISIREFIYFKSLIKWSPEQFLRGGNSSEFYTGPNKTKNQKENILDQAPFVAP